MSRLLLDDKPLLLLPSLAKVIGVNEAILIQQLHYWLQESQHFHGGYKWIYNTYEDWNEQFPFWSISTIRRIITKLENSKLIITGNFNRKTFDKTKWYRIDYKKLDDLSSAKTVTPCVQREQTACSDCTDGEVNLNTPIPESTSEITTDIVDDDKECANKSKLGNSDGVPTTEPEMANEVSLSPDEIAKAIEHRYIQLRASGLFLSAKDFQYIFEIAQSGIELSDAIQWLDESFTMFKPKFPADKINSFAYCRTHILNRAYEKQQRAKAKISGGGSLAKFPRSDGTNNKKQPGASEETKRLDEIARERGLLKDGEIRDIDCDF
ncbi:hypothetical protein [Schinkia azotoformans]|uniref:hypothetical protein n=1 Tax=Schinkia azotoformans TaxID=1454 RepID=UPI002DB91888|nr:hypothetical protein [Schinkia azotoformans]MEC1744147.1 hypothetical protein [Schinkia azotoformans]